MDADERAHQAAWDRDTFGPASHRPAPEGVVSTPFEAAWVALERERVSVFGSLGELRAAAEEAQTILNDAKEAAARADRAVAKATDTLRRLREQQQRMAE